jgi:hypothetical protein
MQVKLPDGIIAELRVGKLARAIVPEKSFCTINAR